MEIKDLIDKMKEVRETYPERTLDEILKLFNIQAMQELTKMIWRASNK